MPIGVGASRGSRNYLRDGANNIQGANPCPATTLSAHAKQTPVRGRLFARFDARYFVDTEGIQHQREAAKSE